jgi:hypothetical protein
MFSILQRAAITNSTDQMMTNSPEDERIDHWNVNEKQYNDVDYVAVK